MSKTIPRNQLVDSILVNYDNDLESILEHFQSRNRSVRSLSDILKKMSTDELRILIYYIFTTIKKFVYEDGKSIIIKGFGKFYRIDRCNHSRWQRIPGVHKSVYQVMKFKQYGKKKTLQSN